jgi:pimeloyl-ACP methyl ester carboxylesterase
VKPRNALILALSAAGIGAAAAGLYRSTHPAEARGPITPAAGRRRPPSDHLFDLPDDVVHHEIPTSDGGVVHAVEKGSGRPLVLLHGITLRHDVWAPQFHQLVDRYRVISVDLRGHGRSRAGSAGFGLSRLGDDLALLLEHLDLEGAVVAGHSMGGMTVMQFCAEHPDVLDQRVAGLIFVATRAHQVLPPYLVDGARHLVGRGQAMVDEGHRLPARAMVTEQLSRLAFGDHPSHRAVALVAEMGRSMEHEALVPSVAGLLEHDARDALRATNTPSLVVVGTRDILTPVPAGRHLAHLLPRSEFVVLPKAGHQLMQERPDELAELIDHFVAAIEGEAASVEASVATEGDLVDADQVEQGTAS